VIFQESGKNVLHANYPTAKFPEVAGPVNNAQTH
jgi:hypothetical protein